MNNSFDARKNTCEEMKHEYATCLSANDECWESAGLTEHVESSCDSAEEEILLDALCDYVTLDDEQPTWMHV